MGMLDRYKKKGGFGQLLQLIETSPQKKKEQFLALIAEESPVWEEHLRKKLLTIEKIYSWDQQVLAEILTRLQPLTLAVALHGNPPEETEKLLACLPPITKRKITDLIAEANPNPAEKATCMMKIITEVRGYVAQGIIKLEKIDPDLHIPENFEEMIANMSAGFSPDVIIIKGGASVENSSSDSHAKPAASSGDHGAQQEIEFLRRKVNQMASEMNAVKHENSVLKDKLAQIKKIA
jgi:hypothetical protein